jgi:dipeptidyl aminopeptidase/acylaminoacyl peptidase
LSRISAGGGPVTDVTQVDAAADASTHEWPDILPGGGVVLYTVEHMTGAVNDAKVAVLDLRTGKSRIVLTRAKQAHYLSTAHLAFLQSEGLKVAPFESERAELRGPVRRVVDEILMTRGFAHFALGARTLVYLAGERPSNRLVWVTREGRVEPLRAPVGNYHQPALSPDGHRIAVTVSDNDVWIFDRDREMLEPATFGGHNYWPIWTPNGKRIVYASSRNGPLELFWKSADASLGDEKLGKGSSPQSISPNGSTLMYADYGSRDTGLYLLPLLGDRRPSPFIKSPFITCMALFSPDGRYVAYTSNDSGVFETYVRPFDAPEPRTRISTAGGLEPLWSRDGSELFYRSGDAMMAVEVSMQPAFSARRPHELFRGRFRPGGRTNYDVAPDGRFLMIEELESAPVTQIHVVLDWMDEAKASR